MKLTICTKFYVNRMNCVESRRGGGPIYHSPPPPSVRVTIFSSRLLGLNVIFSIVCAAVVFHKKANLYTAVSKKVVIVNSRYWNRKELWVL